MSEIDANDRCAVCGWPLVDDRKDGCVRGDCSMRPRPKALYDAERAHMEENTDYRRDPVNWPENIR